MKYALGNMLNGAGGLNADQLALDLQFAADKTLTARKGPTPVLTRGSTGTFVGSNGLIQSAAINAARFDHDPVTLACKGLLIEESRTNSILQSENFASATWNKGGGSISSVANVAPNGNANSELFSEDATTGAHRVFQSFVGTIGTTYTLSVFLKFNGRAEVALENRSIGINPIAVFNIQNGTIGFVSVGLTAAIQAYPNGWYRCSIAGTSTLAGGNYLIAGYSATATYTGLNGPAFYIYGAQVEAGSFLTSYIPTTTASLARSADVCSITGGNFTSFYNQPEGTLFGSGIVDTVGVGLLFPTFLSLSDGTANNRIILGSTNSGGAAVRPIILNSGSNIYNQSVGTVSAGQSRKVALAYKESDYRAAANSQLATAGTTGSPPSGLNRADINSIFFVGTISAIRYYKKRLPNAKLQALTALVSDPDANAYIVSLLAAGATVTESQRNAINTFYQTGKADGWYSSLKRIYLPIWGIAAPNAICMTSLSSGTFNGTVTHGAGFVKSDTTTGYMNTNVGIVTLGLSLSSYHFAGLYKTSSGQANSYLLGSQAGGNVNRFFMTATSCTADLSSATLGRVVGTVASGNRLGVFTFSGSASNRFLKQRKTSGVTTLATTTTTIVAQPNNINVAFLANNSSGTISSFCGEEIGAFSMGLEMNDAQDTAYSLALKSLWEGTTGLVLP